MKEEYEDPVKQKHMEICDIDIHEAIGSAATEADFDNDFEDFNRILVIRVLEVRVTVFFTNKKHALNT
jgi:hypothetical protein